LYIKDCKRKRYRQGVGRILTKLDLRDHAQAVVLACEIAIPSRSNVAVTQVRIRSVSAAPV